VLSEYDEGSTFVVARAVNGGYEMEITDPAVIREGLSFEYVDALAAPGSRCVYRVDVVTEGLSRNLFVTDAIDVPAAALSLRQNVPNPFNPSTVIGYLLPARGQVTLAVYDAAGRRVSTIIEDVQDAGSHEIEWRGNGDEAGPLSSGVYFCRLTFDRRVLTRKMILLR
jgi:hypothetical protein